MTLPRVLATATFRLALLYALLFSASAAVLFATLYWSMTGYAEDEIRNRIEADAADLRDEARDAGLAHLRRSIDERLAGPGARTSRYLLEDASGHRLAGNLSPGSLLPAHLKPGWHAFTPPSPVEEGGEDILPEPDNDAKVLGLAVTLPGGEVLFVGQKTEQLTRLRELIIRAFVSAGAVTIVLGLLGAAVMSQGFLGRIGAFNRTIGRIVEGDMTERVPTRGTGDPLDALAANINGMLDRIVALMEDLSQVSNDIAHDLRTPVARLRQGLETARRKATSIAEYEDACDRAIIETEGILRTFGALLHIAQIGAGLRRDGFTAVDLSDIFETIVDTYAAVAEERDQVLTGEIAGGIAIRGDRELLTQMLANLVENAIHHTGDGSRIHVALTMEGGRPVAEITDTGPGIPAAERAHVFRRFYRLDASRTTPGSGLGLSLVAAIADLHGITVTLSDNQPGLCVTLTFVPLPAP